MNVCKRKKKENERTEDREWEGMKKRKIKKVRERKKDNECIKSEKNKDVRR